MERRVTLGPLETQPDCGIREVRLNGTRIGSVALFRDGAVAAVGLAGKWLRIRNAALGPPLPAWPTVRAAVREALRIPTDHQLALDLAERGIL